MPLDPTVVLVHAHTGSAPSTAPSSVGRPGRGGGGAVVSAGMGPGHLYRPYVPPHKIRRGCCLSLFVAINALTVLSALSVAVAEILSIVYHRLSRTFVYVCVGFVGTAQSDGRIHPPTPPTHQSLSPQRKPSPSACTAWRCPSSSSSPSSGGPRRCATPRCCRTGPPAGPSTPCKCRFVLVVVVAYAVIVVLWACVGWVLGFGPFFLACLV